MLVPIVIAALCTFSTTAILGAAIQVLQSHRQGLLAADYLVYVVTPYDLGWQLRTSGLRVLLQAVPAGVLLLFLLVRDPAIDPAERTSALVRGLPA